MAFYTYECAECGVESNERRNMSDPTKLIVCPSCGGNLWQHIYPSAIKFNGPGFYVNDYQNSRNQHKRFDKQTKDEVL
jgi:putative FmdB family regulatory protein